MTAAVSPKLRALYDKVLGQYDKMLEMAKGPEATLEKLNPAVSQWNVRQHLDHMAKVDGFISMMAIEGALKTPPQNADKRPKFSARILLTLGHLPRGKGKAPDATHPKAKNAQELITGLTMVQPFLKKLEGRLGEMGTSVGRTPHPILGAFNAAEWLRFLDIHHRHHFKIIADILK